MTAAPLRYTHREPTTALLCLLAACLWIANTCLKGSMLMPVLVVLVKFLVYAALIAAAVVLAVLTAKEEPQS